MRFFLDIYPKNIPLASMEVEINMWSWSNIFYETVTQIQYEYPDEFVGDDSITRYTILYTSNAGDLFEKYNEVADTEEYHYNRTHLK